MAKYFSFFIKIQVCLFFSSGNAHYEEARGTKIMSVLAGNEVRWRISGDILNTFLVEKTWATARSFGGLGMTKTGGRLQAYVDNQF